MKKRLAVILAAAVSLSLSACSQRPEAETPAQLTIAQAASTNLVAAPRTEYVFPAQTLIKEQGIVVTAIYLKTVDVEAPELTLRVENNSERNITIHCENAAINGYMVDPVVFINAKPGTSSIETLTFQRENLTRSGIKTMSSLELSLRVYEKGQWDKIIETPMIPISLPYSLELPEIDNESGTCICDRDDIRIFVQGTAKNQERQSTDILIYTENNSDHNQMLLVKDLKVNGHEIDPIFFDSIYAGKRSVEAITVFQQTLTENRIREIQEIDLSMQVVEIGTWEQTITTTPAKIHMNEAKDR